MKQDEAKIIGPNIKGKDQQTQTQYYVENGYVVFTEAYHLARGSCCGSGCRHCPYKKKSK